MDALAAKLQRDFARRLIDVGARRARLHVVGDHARVDDLEGRLSRRLGEHSVRLVLIADVGVVGGVGRRAVEHQRRPWAHGFLHVDHRRQDLPIDSESLGGLFCDADGLGDDHRDEVADMIDDAVRHHRIGFERGLRAVGILDRSEARQAAEAGEVHRDVDGAHARHGADGGEIGDLEARVRVRAAHESGLEFGAFGNVGREAALSRDQPHVFHTFHALPGAEFSCAHFHPPHRRGEAPRPIFDIKSARP